MNESINCFDDVSQALTLWNSHALWRHMTNVSEMILPDVQANSG